MIAAILLWLACGYAGCKVIGLSKEYLEYFIGTAITLICGGIITLIASIIIWIKGEKIDDRYKTR